LYDVGLDALDSLQPSTEVKIFTYQRHYAYMVLLNVQRPHLRDASFRRKLNNAIDRPRLIAEGLDGHATPAVGPVWPYHWAVGGDFQGFGYQPQRISEESQRIRFTCSFPDSYVPERLALALRRQMQAVGVDLVLEALPLDEMLNRLKTGDFDSILSDFVHAPALVRPYLFWHSGGPFNFGHFSSLEVDAALDSIRHAQGDPEYKAGVAAFQRAILEDPPAIFLAWTERARAVSRRFTVPAEPGQDVWGTLRLWRPAPSGLASLN
jgi:peptide/nickel transport system substrate-binding protein